MTPRKEMVQPHPGSLCELVCRCFRRHTSSVRRKAGFESRTDLCIRNKWAARPMERRLACNQEIGVQLPGCPLNNKGSWSKGKTSGWQSENPGSIPGESTDTEGSRIRLAGPHC